MPAGIGLPEILVVAFIALLVLGPKRLPAAGRALGRGLREFRGAVDQVTEPAPVRETPVAIVEDHRTDGPDEVQVGSGHHAL